MKRLLLLSPIVLLTCGAGKRELVSYICEYRNFEDTAEKMIADLKKDWGGAKHYIYLGFLVKAVVIIISIKALRTHRITQIQKDPKKTKMKYMCDTGIVNGVLKAIASTYEISNSGNSLTYKAVFGLNMDTMSEAWTVLYPDDRKDFTDKCMLISLP